MTLEDEHLGPKGLPLLTHALELRRRVVIVMAAFLAGSVLCYFFAPELYAFLVRPLAQASGASHRLIYTGLTEAFVTYLKLAMWGGAMLAFPVAAAQVWFFAAPGLYREERMVFLSFLTGAPILFLLGAALAYGVVFPLAWTFFLGFETPALSGGLPIQMEARVSEYLSLSMTLIFAFGLAFQLPIVLVLLARAGLVSAQKLAESRRFAVVLVFVAAAVLTPPDVISQIALAVPLLALYEVSIWGARWAESRRERLARENGQKSEG